MKRDDIEHYVMGQFDGDVAALERAIVENPALAAIVADEARLELVLREAAAAATFCVACEDLVRGERCTSCGAAVRPGGYTVERVLVANAHGRMYVARDADGKQVALKELAFVQAPTAAALAAFEREAKLLRALEHPAIPRFVASFEEGEGVHLRYYLAQELVAGTPLDRLDDHWYTEAEVVALAKQVLSVLVYLQSLSPMVIHRDVKPANLIRKADGAIALVDFGAAHVHGTTAGSTTIGTFGYMPLEQLAGEVDATTDAYALGMTMLHLLTRQEPWRLAQTRPAINVSAPLRAFLDKLVAPEPRARFASAKDALAALETLGARRTALPSMRRFARPALYAAAAAVVAVSGIGVYGVLSADPAPTPGTLRVTISPAGEIGSLYVDGTWITRVGDGDEIPILGGRHDLQVRLDQGTWCKDNLKLYPGHLRWASCTARAKPAPPRLVVEPIPPAAMLVDPEPSRTAMRLTLLPYGTVGSLYIDDNRIGWASDGMEIPLKPGSHYIKVVFDNGDVCIKALGLLAGQVRSVECYRGVPPPTRPRRGAPDVIEIDPRSKIDPFAPF